MNTFRNIGRRSFSRVPSPPWVANSGGHVLLNSATRIEEERMPAYDRNLYFPVHLGDVYASRYQVISKLGYGANSTVWFCRDLHDHRYVAVKVYIRTSQSDREVQVLRHLSTIKSDHPGRTGIRAMVDCFDIDEALGKHQCIVHEVLLTSLLHFQATFNPPRLNEDLVRGALKELLYALDFLHTEAHVVHTDIQAKNIIISSKDDSIFQEWDEEEQAMPSARKVSKDKLVYKSRPFHPKGMLRRLGVPILSDFGEARVGDLHSGSVQPDIFRAPEVVLEMQWTSKIDIWNVGVMTWGLLEGRHLFDARELDGIHSDTKHLAEMIGLLGPPPVDFLRRSDQSLKYWNDEGKWRGAVEIPKKSLGDLDECFDGQEKDLFMQLMHKMLQWDPEQRQSARELLTDPWLNNEILPEFPLLTSTG